MSRQCIATSKWAGQLSGRPYESELAGSTPRNGKAYRAHGLRGYWMVRYRRRQVNDNDAAEIAARVGDTEKAGENHQGP